MGSSTLIGEWSRQFAELVEDLVCVCREGRIVWINGAGHRLMTGTAPGAPLLVGRAFRDLVHGDYRDIVDMGLGVLADDGGAMPLLMQALDGRVIEVELKASRVAPSPPSILSGDEDGEAVLIHARDVTERARAVANLLESEHRYRNVVEMSLNLIFVVQDDRLVVVNGTARKLLGGDRPEDLLTGGFADLVHADYRDIVDLGLEALAAEDGVLPLKMVGLDAAVHDMEVRVIPFGSHGFMIEARDISDRMRSAEALREREARLQGVLDTVAEGIVTADERGVIQSVNPAAERLFGWQRNELVGRNLSVLMPTRYAAYHDGHMATYHGGGPPKSFGRTRELEGLRKDGSVFPIELSLAEMRIGRSRLYTGVIRDITQRKRAEEAMKRYNEELETHVRERTEELRALSRQSESILESAGDGIVALDNDGLITVANPAAAEMLGWRREDLPGKDAAGVFRYGDGRRCGRPVPVRAALRRGMFHDSTELTLLRRDGGTFEAEYASAPIEDNGTRSGAVVLFRDISERKKAEGRLRVAATVFDTTAEGIAVCEADGTITTVNPAFATITGEDAAALVGRSVGEVFGCGAFDQGVMLEALAAEGHWVGEQWSCRPRGEEYASRIAASAVPSEDGEETLRQFVVVVNDITQRKRDEERIRYQANYDALTGLPNRALFLDRLEHGVAAARRSGATLGLMFIDLDGFKAVNDTLGHEAGDDLLKGAADRLRKCVRESDTVARLGGDEFTIIMDNVEGRPGAAIVAQRIIRTLEVPFDLGGREGRVSASIGIALFPADAADCEELLRNADTAMYAAKAQGKKNHQFYEPEAAPEAEAAPA
ncbi:bifunctional diguanylate cyclase/phosphodiesterase [Caenispirillum bisanense]|uniref:Sensor protein FixL n=1 Tax=Caenispirillum bisanense TaxID=414052 RepID=A0A286GJX7_9PROT|nr:PAS domain S-box protein [Caenispirillum bisanense]SOD95841.1 PAS domain S-box-containing protein/diguanylate cyclase (GGDEF) domain-containing protein [Caenispirillum bisanense]